MAKVGRSARLKGHNFEREIANTLSEQTNLDWHRGLGQTRNGGSETSDVECDKLPNIHIECKRHKRVNVKSAWAQALSDAPTKTKIIIHKNDREPIMVTMSFEEWLELFKEWLKTQK